MGFYVDSRSWLLWSLVNTVTVVHSCVFCLLPSLAFEITNVHNFVYTWYQVLYTVQTYPRCLCWLVWIFSSALWLSFLLQSYTVKFFLFFFFGFMSLFLFIYIYTSKYILPSIHFLSFRSFSLVFRSLFRITCIWVAGVCMLCSSHSVRWHGIALSTLLATKHCILFSWRYSRRGRTVSRALLPFRYRLLSCTAVLSSFCTWRIAFMLNSCTWLLKCAQTGSPPGLPSLDQLVSYWHSLLT